MRLIDADALYLAVSRDGSHCIGLGTKTGVSWATGLEVASRLIRNAPTIEAELVKHGRWINTRCIVGGFHDVWGSDCSECGTTVKDDYPNYCPNCGAKMEAE